MLLQKLGEVVVHKLKCSYKWKETFWLPLCCPLNLAYDATWCGYNFSCHVSQRSQDYILCRWWLRRQGFFNKFWSVHERFLEGNVIIGPFLSVAKWKPTLTENNKTSLIENCFETLVYFLRKISDFSKFWNLWSYGLENLIIGYIFDMLTSLFSLFVAWE